MNMRKGFAGVLLLSIMLFPAMLPQAQESSIDLSLAQSYFREAEGMSRLDNGTLWGIPLYGPMLFVDAETRDIVANQADLEGKLRQRNQVFVGKLPKEENIANTATKWGGVQWTMMIWPLPEDRQDRTRLMAHELFHRVQTDLGLSATNPENLHLATRDGRIWLQFEWRALERALRASPPDRRQLIADALVFRAYRRSLFPRAASEEDALEMNEGLAEYTGVRVSTNSSPEAATDTVCDLRRARYKPSFVRSFAYISGPAYGELLDLAAPYWRRGLKGSDDLGSLLLKAFALKLPPIARSEALKRANRYDGETLIAEETRKDIQRQEQLAQLRGRFIDHPILVLPLSTGVNYSYNPNNVMALGEIGTVYPTMRVTDTWGVIEVSKGALLIREGGHAKRLQVPLPADLDQRPLKGDGWTLELNQGWKLEPGDRKGDYVLKHTEVP